MKNRNGKESGLEDEKEKLFLADEVENTRRIIQIVIFFSPKTRAGETHWHIFIIKLHEAL